MHLNFPIRLREQIKFIGDPDIDFEISSDLEQDNKINGFEYEPPEVFIVSKSTDGQIRLGFSDNLLEVRDLNSMLTDRVAVPTDHANSETIVIFDRDKRSFSRAYIRNATEVLYLPAE